MDIGSVTTIQAAAQHTERHRSAIDPPLTGTSRLLGLSVEEVAGARRAGTTLRQLAARQGVTDGDLLKALTGDLRAAKPLDAPQLSEAQLADQASAIADGALPTRTEPRPGMLLPEGGAESAFVDIASWLGLDPATLLGTLEDGVSLSDVAARQGSTIGQVLSRLGGATSLVFDARA